MKNNRIIISLLLLIVGLYIGYFSVFTVLRIRALYAHYFDLGIMHQAVYNTYQAIRTADWSRILEISNPHGTGFVKRMAVHNDVLLALLSPLYFLYSGPQTLVVLQTIVLGLGALALFGICREVLPKYQYKDLAGLVFSFAYLMYVPMQRANMFDFHAVTLATSFLLFMYYFWLKKNFLLSFLFFIASLLTKENIGMTTFLLGVLMILPHIGQLLNKKLSGGALFAFWVMLLSGIWVFLSMVVIIPYFRGSEHFALARYSVLKDPGGMVDYIFHKDTYLYLLYIFGPLGFLSFLSPLHLAVSIFEFAINLFSDSWNMRNIIHHYTSVIQPIVFIAAVYGFRNLVNWSAIFKIKAGFAGGVLIGKSALALIVISTLVFSYVKGPLPYAKQKDIHPIKYPAAGYGEVQEWGELLKEESISVSSTGHLAPFFTSRRYYYHFADEYENADYVVLQLDELYNYFDEEVDLPAQYEKLKADGRYVLLYRSPQIEVFRRNRLNQ